MKKFDFCGLTGEIITPENPAYEEARQEWNRAIQRYPLVINYCFKSRDVSNAILWARKNCVGFRIRSGGHNYAGYSTGDCVLVIDISKMDGLMIDCEENLLFVQGGVKNRQLYNFVASKGYPFPSGTCPTVGVSGIVSGGGWGLSCRRYGLACDSLVEAELVDYTGRILKASSECNADLFWAIRGGGGGNFGVIISMTFRLPPKTGKVTFVEIHYPKTGKAKQEQFLSIWQKWLVDADKKMTLIARIYNSQDEGRTIYSEGIFYGHPEQAAEILSPFAAIEGGKLSLEYITFEEAINKIEDAYPSSEMFKSVGRFVNRDYNYCEIEKIVVMINDRPKGSVLTGISLYALGGEVAKKSRRDTAFFYRSARYIINLQSVWEDPRFEDDNVEWVRQRARYLESVTVGSYVNFPDSDLVDYEDAYYGLNAEKLQIIKQKYDPHNVFNFPQSIKGVEYPY